MSKKKGFTLLEVMISLAIVSGLLVTLSYSLNYHLGIAGRHEFITMATMLAKNKLTEIETLPVNSKGDFPEPYGGYQFITETKAYSFPGISEISVTVSRDRDEVKLSRLIQTPK